MSTPSAPATDTPAQWPRAAVVGGADARAGASTGTAPAGASAAYGTSADSPVVAPRAAPPAPTAGSVSDPIVILGGGPIGMACALLLAQQGIGCTLLDARPVAALQRDRRLLALSRGTLNILEPLLGKDFAPRGEIHRIHVSSAGNAGSAQLGSRDFGGVAVGATVWYADLVEALARALAAAPLVSVQRPQRAVEVRQKVHVVEVALDNGAVLQGSVAIDAEGTPPQTRDAAQYALLAEMALPVAPGDAIERFTPEGPLALLPLPGAGDIGKGDGANTAGHVHRGTTRLSMVWCLDAQRARLRRDLPEAELCALVGRALGPRVGAPTALGPRSIFPLLTFRRENVCEHRVVHLGNAAQSLHPVAGQGFNLGMRDCAGLVQCLVESPLHAGGADPLRALQRYAERRRLDRTLFPALTNVLPWVFASALPPVVLARSVALAGLDLFPLLRRPVTRILMFGAPR
jgi:2-octaprenyl-6-methoxyphenol hydroxylase